jgi:hypothetical protein
LRYLLYMLSDTLYLPCHRWGYLAEAALPRRRHHRWLPG